MKKIALSLFTLAGLFAITSCNSNESTSTTTDSTSMTDTSSTASMQTSSTQTTRSSTRTIQLNPSTSYVELSTGKSVRLRVDTVTKYIVNEVTNQPILYFIDPATKDTFDRQGRIVNRAIRKSSSGEYSVDETLLQSDNDANNMSADTTTTSTPANAPGDSKEKLKDDKYKYKDDNNKVKVKDDKAKVKTNP